MDIQVNDTLPKEQIEKRIIIPEVVDLNGLVHRQRTLDGNLFDKLFIQKKITAAMHCAAEEFIKTLSISGMFIRSPSLQPREFDSGSNNVEKNLSFRYMAMSNVISYLKNKHSDNDIKILLVFCNYDIVNVKKYINEIRLILLSLSDYYGTGLYQDPRDLF